MKEQEASANSDLDDKIALRAYELWIARGSPIGSPEIDWFAAERTIQNGNASIAAESQRTPSLE